MFSEMHSFFVRKEKELINTIAGMVVSHILMKMHDGMNKQQRHTNLHRRRFLNGDRGTVDIGPQINELFPVLLGDS